MIPRLTRISRRVHGRVGFLQRPIAGDENWFKRVLAASTLEPKVGSSPGSIDARRLTASYFRTAG